MLRCLFVQKAWLKDIVFGRSGDGTMATDGDGVERQIGGKLNTWRASPRVMLCISLLVVTVSFVAGFAVSRSYSVDWGYFTPAFVLFVATVPMLWVFYDAARTPHGTVQVFIVVITVASFYAFGWPHKLVTEELAHSFSELCVILVLFLLAELAAYLTLTSEGLATKLESVGTATVRSIEEKAEPISKKLEQLLDKLDLEKFSESIQTLSSISKIAEALSSHPRVRDEVIGEIANYAETWARFLESPLSYNDDQFNLRLECCRRFFKTYLESERAGIEWRSKVNERPRPRIAADDRLYFEIMNQMLQAHSEADRIGPSKMFAWAITNVSPLGFYHWGDRYGHFGRHPFMDQFRQTVGEIVKAGNTYQRLFLFFDGTEDQMAAEKATGIPLELLNRIADLDTKVLLLVSTVKGAEPSDLPPRPMREWTEMGVWNDIWDCLLAGREKFFPPDNLYYGIVEASVCQRMNWQIGELKQLEMDHALMHNYWIKPVKLLDHFEITYQSPGGMFVLPVRWKDPLDALPGGYPDCLILGRQIEQEYRPVIAIATHVDLESDSMRMQIFTSREDLEEIQRNWEGIFKVQRTGMQQIRTRQKNAAETADLTQVTEAPRTESKPSERRRK
jgi:hypothetical protein